MARILARNLPTALIAVSMLAILAMLQPFAVPAPARAGETQDAAQRLDALFADTFDARLDLDPSLANRVGDPRAPGRMTVSLTDEYRARERQVYERALDALGRIPLDGLDPRRRTWAEAFRWLLEMNIELLGQPLHLLPLMPGADFPSEFANLAGGDADLAMDSAADLRHYASRAEDLDRWVDAAIANLRRGAASGFVHPKLVVLRQLQTIRGTLSGPREDTVFWRPIHSVERLELPAAERTALRSRLEEVTESTIVPAYARLHAFLADEYLDQARDGLGLADLEGGAEVYGALVRYFTTLDLPPEEIFAIGEEETTSWKKRQRMTSRLLDGNLQAFVRDDEQVLQTFRDLEDTVRGRLDDLFLDVPEAPLAIRLVEPHMAALGGAFYRAPPADGSRPGTFFVRPGGFDLYNAEALFLHEGLPGHHFQIALAQEQHDLPSFLRWGYSGAFVEGWGLYAESLGDELGLYRHPSSRLGRQRFALGRAGRLVGDVGIHHLGWDHAEAERELGRRDLAWARGEIGRYATIPAQALGYTLGERKISELRRRAEKALGRRFDVRAFHRAVLEDGPLPLVVLEAKIERWIAAQADSDETSPR